MKDLKLTVKGEIGAPGKDAKGKDFKDACTLSAEYGLDLATIDATADIAAKTVAVNVLGSYEGILAGASYKCGEKFNFGKCDYGLGLGYAGKDFKTFLKSTKVSSFKLSHYHTVASDLTLSVVAEHALESTTTNEKTKKEETKPAATTFSTGLKYDMNKESSFLVKGDVKADLSAAVSVGLVQKLSPKVELSVSSTFNCSDLQQSASGVALAFNL